LEREVTASICCVHNVRDSWSGMQDTALIRPHLGPDLLIVSQFACITPAAFDISVTFFSPKDTDGSSRMEIQIINYLQTEKKQVYFFVALVEAIR
jgi:hypothetical protein